MFIRIVFSVFFLSGIFQGLRSQNREFIWIGSDIPSNISDSLLIIPSSIQIRLNQNPLDSNVFKIQKDQKSISIQTTFASTDTLRVSYSTLPAIFSKPFFHKDERSMLQPKERDYTFSYTAGNEPDRNPWAASTLQKNGSISRGISFGNSQNLSVSSNLNLQLSGKISDDVQILAAITDNNIPIQPEGNTQQLQDFDQVFIQLFTDEHKLIAGDYPLQEKNRYFLRYFKKAQGLSYQSTLPINKKGTLSTRLSGAASRGKFARQTLNQQEGNQGPYRLLGAENELFIIILSGTERIFIDGELLTRGLENDYVIDYNTAEIIFTPKRLITKDRRITVEFQYSDRNYVRTLADASVEYNTENTSIYATFFTEQDHKNQPVQENLTDQKKLFLEGIGDNLSLALFPSADTASYSQNKILYEKKDSLGYTFYTYSTDSTKTLYQLVFSLVGQGNGNYIQTQSSANGKVYAWIAPDTVGGRLVLQGNYEALELLITPKQRQMGVFGVKHTGKKNQILVETALSKNDVNTFSNIDAQNDYGMAFKVKDTYVGKEKPKGYFMSHGIQYEFVHQNFKEIEWFRNAEFTRDWNIGSTSLNKNQHLGGFTSGLSHTKYGKLFEYQLNTYISELEYEGWKHVLNSQFNTKHWTVQSVASYLTSTKDTNTTQFVRHKSLFAYHHKAFVVGVKDDIERNLFYGIGTDVLPSSYQFLEGEVFVRSPDSSKNTYQLAYIHRTDEHVVLGALRPFTEAKSVQADFDLFKNSTFNVKGRSSYRDLRIKDAQALNIKPENTFLNRVEYSWRAFKNTLQLGSFYELGSGVEARREYTYIEVAAGQGAYTWIDYNSNNIKELNEFESAVFQDQANYIRVFTPTTQYIQTKNNQFSQTFFIQPERILKSSKAWYKIFSIFSDQCSYKIDWKSTGKNFSDYFNPISVQAEDTSLLGLNKLFKNSFFLYRTDPVKGFTVNYHSSANKFLSNNGFEYKNLQYWEAISRINLKAKYLVELRYLRGEKESNNAFFILKKF
jgi:hypothetical protein